MAVVVAWLLLTTCGLCYSIYDLLDAWRSLRAARRYAPEDLAVVLWARHSVRDQAIISGVLVLLVAMGATAAIDALTSFIFRAFMFGAAGLLTCKSILTRRARRDRLRS